MRLSVATNFEEDLISALKEYPVVELYGKLASDIVGGGRSSYMLSPLSKKKLANHVAFAKKNNIRFNYLLNAACLDNIETTRLGQKRIRTLLEWISNIEVGAVTVTNPLLVRMIKKNYPHLKVRISVFAGVDHLQKAKYWEEIGADTICLDSLTVNRDFKTLKLLRKALKCDLELLVNNNCLQSCSLSQTHMNLLAHSSQKKHQNKGFVVDHCFLECSKLKIKDSVHYIRSDWIRPEDIHHYESIGFHHFKIVERNLPTPLMVNRVKAYTYRKYEGNLIDLIQPYGHTFEDKKQKYQAHHLFWKFTFLFKPLKVNLWKLHTLHKLGKTKGLLVALKESSPVIIDNQKLDGFIDRFLTNACRYTNCEECQHCHRYAEKAVTIEPEFQKKCVSLHSQLDKEFENGSFWFYRNAKKTPPPHTDSPYLAEKETKKSNIGETAIQADSPYLAEKETPLP
jgi:collagenase-like PrtC family protease